MSRGWMDRLDDPELIGAELNRRRHLMAWYIIGGIVLAVGVLFAATVAMYSDGPEAAKVTHPTR